MLAGFVLFMNCPVEKGKNEDDSRRQISLQVKPGDFRAGDGVD